MAKAASGWCLFTSPTQSASRSIGFSPYRRLPGGTKWVSVMWINFCISSVPVLYQLSLCVLRPQQAGRVGLGLELEIDLVKVDLGGRAGGEAAVGVDGNAALVDARQGTLDPAREDRRGLRHPRRHVDDAEPDLEVFAQAAQALEVVGAGCGELHREMMHLAPV